MMKDLVITSLETITAFDITTGAFKFALDELTNASIAQTQDKEDITGKKGRKLSSLKRNKAVTISGENGMVSGGLFELQTGVDFEEKVTKVMWADYITVTSNTSATEYKAVGTAGAEISEMYIRNADGTLGDKLTQASAASEGKFAYDPDTKALTFSALADGTELVAYYNRNITASVLNNESDKYSGKCALYIDAIGEDKCANIYRIQFYIPKADFSGEWTFEMGDNQTVHSFEAEALSGACGTSGSFFTYTVFGEKTPDA